VTSFGLFVQLEELMIDGLVHITSLKRDYYHFDPVRHRLVGESSNRSYQLGDRLEIQIMGVNMEEKKIDFDLVANLGDDSVKPKKGKKVKKSGDKYAGKTKKAKKSAQSDDKGMDKKPAKKIAKKPARKIKKKTASESIQTTTKPPVKKTEANVKPKARKKPKTSQKSQAEKTKT